MKECCKNIEFKGLKKVYCMECGELHYHYSRGMTRTQVRELNLRKVREALSILPKHYYLKVIGGVLKVSILPPISEVDGSVSIKAEKRSMKVSSTLGLMVGIFPVYQRTLCNISQTTIYEDDLSTSIQENIEKAITCTDRQLISKSNYNTYVEKFERIRAVIAKEVSLYAPYTSKLEKEK